MLQESGPEVSSAAFLKPHVLAVQTGPEAAFRADNSRQTSSVRKGAISLLAQSDNNQSSEVVGLLSTPRDHRPFHDL